MSEITGLARIVPSEKRPLPPGWWREVATPILEQCDTLAALDEQERLTFVGNEESAPFPSLLFYLGEDYGKFYHHFAEVGDVWQRIEPGMFGE